MKIVRCVSARVSMWKQFLECHASTVVSHFHSSWLKLPVGAWYCDIDTNFDFLEIKPQ